MIPKGLSLGATLTISISYLSIEEPVLVIQDIRGRLTKNELIAYLTQRGEMVIYTKYVFSFASPSSPQRVLELRKDSM